MTSESGTRRIDVDYLARVEGEGSMKVKVVDGVIEDVEFGIFEPPRFFEAFMRGRMFTEAPDITARICGICPIAYQMSSVHAMEDVLGVTVDGQLRALRRLIYCGEWIESHVLHVYMLHAPDFLGYQSAIHMAADHRDIVEQGSAAEEGRQHDRDSARRSRDPPDQRPRRRLLPCAGQGRIACAHRTSSSGPGTLRWRPCVGSRSCRRRRSRWTSSSYRCLTRTSTRSTRAGSSPTRGSTSHCLSSTTCSRRSTSPAPTPSTRGSRSEAPTTSVRWPATASTSRSYARSPRVPRSKPGLDRSAPTRSRASWCGRWRSLHAVRGGTGASSTPTSVLTLRTFRWCRRRAWATEPARRRGACCTTATSWTRMAASSMRRSCLQRHRTS